MYQPSFEELYTVHHFSLMAADRFEIAVEQIGKHAAANVGRLGRRPDGQKAANRIGIGNNSTGLYSHAAAAVLPDLFSEHVQRRRKGCVGIAICHAESRGNVVVEREMRPWRIRLIGSRVGWSLAVDPTGHTLAVSVDKSGLELIDRASGRREQISPDGLDATTRAVGFSPWNSDIISGDEKGVDPPCWRRCRPQVR